MCLVEGRLVIDIVVIFEVICEVVWENYIEVVRVVIVVFGIFFLN